MSIAIDKLTLRYAHGERVVSNEAERPKGQISRFHTGLSSACTLRVTGDDCKMTIFCGLGGGCLGHAHGIGFVGNNCDRRWEHFRPRVVCHTERRIWECVVYGTKGCIPALFSKQVSASPVVAYPWSYNEQYGTFNRRRNVHTSE